MANMRAFGLSAFIDRWWERVETYSVTCHGQERAVVVAIDRILLSFSSHQIVKVADRTDFGCGKRFDRKIAGNDQNDSGMQPIRDQGCFDAADEGVKNDSNGQQECRGRDVDTSPG